MQIPLEISFEGFDRSDALEQNIRDRAAKIERFYQHIVGCHVVVEAPHRHHHKGNLYSVRIEITVPDGELIVNRNPQEHHSHEDVYVAIRDAFKAARRQLEDYARIRRGQVKTHDVPPHGHIIALFPEMDYGKIETADGREIFFHRNSVIEAEFNTLSEGMEVRFNEEMGDQGPKATTVHLIGKHHIVG
ncbi:MAG: HPF/RaiA family ribosome-associated protein [Candidatus Bipolaricaulota bacterium]